MLENIFVHEGSTGHEVMFTRRSCFQTARSATRTASISTRITGEQIIARWFDLADLDLQDGPSLYPAGLKDLLLRRKNQSI
jgi:hypothetical protein